MNRGHAFLQLILARLREFYREPIAIFWVYGFPLILAVILGMAFSTSDVPPPTVDVVLGGDVGIDVVETLKAGTIDVTVSPADVARERLRLAQTSLVVTPTANGVEYTFDPTRPDGVNAKFWVDSLLSRAHAKTPLPTKDDPITAPGSRYIDFLLPGLVGINLMGGGLFGLGFVLVEMRVRKLFKRLMATPMRRGDFLGAMVASRLLFLLPEMTSLLVAARWAFGVPMFGSWGTLALVVVLGSLAFAGIGLLIASRTEKTETVSGLVNLVMLPSYLFSGVFFSSSRFPEAIQPLIQALPLTRLNNALRDVMLEGKSLTEISGHLLVLALWGGFSFALALRWFKWT
jgi:ABC-2 type transport system permease protein